MSTSTSVAAVETSTSRFSGAENFLVGISPHYWAHVPMSVADVNGLDLKDGVNCALVLPATSRCDDRVKFVPVSKCILVGYIVSIDIKSKGTTIYVLDDGTGMIDCVNWTSGDDIFSLPSLMGSHGMDSPEYNIGDLIRVFGKINVIKRELAVGKVCVWDCIREIRINVMEHVQSVDAEAGHWISCSNSVLSVSSTSNTEKECHSLQNSVDFLELLGSDIQEQVHDRRNLPSADDTLAAWRVFGTSCQCSLAYKEALLYCHCQAKLEPLDPNFTFRDTLLSTLLEMEVVQQGRLYFQYKTVATNERLVVIATRMVAATLNPTINANRLFLNTFRALRQDGIVHLSDLRDDSYLLISRDRVLDPYVTKEMQKSAFSGSEKKNFVSFDGAPYLTPKVHQERVLYIRRMCLSKEIKIK
jgi:hypothetical protein